MNIEKMNELMENADFIAEMLVKCKTTEAAVAMMNNAGADCTLEEGAGVLAGLMEHLKTPEETMDLDSMEAVAGGASEEGPDTADLVFDMARNLVSQAVQIYSAGKINRYAGIKIVSNAVLGQINMIADISNNDVTEKTFTTMGMSPEQAAALVASMKKPGETTAQ